MKRHEIATGVKGHAIFSIFKTKIYYVSIIQVIHVSKYMGEHFFLNGVIFALICRALRPQKDPRLGPEFIRQGIKTFSKTKELCVYVYRILFG